jgi:hypothetical protein
VPSNQGRLVVLSLFAGVAAISLLAVLGFWLTGGRDNLRCDEGEASVNPTAESGAIQPLSRSLQTIEDAEAFICHRVARADDGPGWTLTEIVAERDRGLNDIVEGTGYAEVHLRYKHDSSGAIATLIITPFSLPRLAGQGVNPENIEVAGRPALFYEDALGNPVVIWHLRDLDIQASAQLTGVLTRQDFLEFLASVR